MWRTASILVGAVLFLLTFGFIMLASTSSVHGTALSGDPLYFVKRQAIYVGLALVMGFAVTRIDYRLWKDLRIPLAAISILLLILVFVPGIGSTIKGSSRWIRLGPFNFQPSELAKLVLLIVMAWYLSGNRRRTHRFVEGLCVPFVLMGLFVGPIFISPDFGTTMLLVGVSMLLMFVAGTRLPYLIVTGVTFGAVFMIALFQSPVRWRRIMAFLDPEKYALEEAFQLMNAIYAFTVGGLTGVGLGQSLQKRFYLPESHTDFIFAIIGEELGFLASISVVALFVVIFFCGLRISMNAPDGFGKLLALGITLLITLQAAFNIAVVSGALPTKGLPLPFISYGGSSILMSSIMIGILMNIAFKSAELDGED